MFRDISYNILLFPQNILPKFDTPPPIELWRVGTRQHWNTHQSSKTLNNAFIQCVDIYEDITYYYNSAQMRHNKICTILQYLAQCIAKTMILDAMLYALLRSRAGPQNKLNTKGICFLPYTSSHSRLGWIMCYILCHKCRKLKVEHAHSRWSILKAGVALSGSQW